MDLELIFDLVLQDKQEEALNEWFDWAVTDVLGWPTILWQEVDTECDQSRRFELGPNRFNVQFIFDGKTYVQHNGVAMGAPLAPAMADIFMAHLETSSMDDLRKSSCVWAISLCWFYLCFITTGHQHWWRSKHSEWFASIDQLYPWTGGGRFNCVLECEGNTVANTVKKRVAYEIPKVLEFNIIPFERLSERKKLFFRSFQKSFRITQVSDDNIGFRRKILGFYGNIHAHEGYLDIHTRRSLSARHTVSVFSPITYSYFPRLVFVFRMRVSFLSLTVLMVGGSFFSSIPFPAGLEKTSICLPL